MGFGEEGGDYGECGYEFVGGVMGCGEGDEVFWWECY